MKKQIFSGVIFLTVSMLFLSIGNAQSSLSTVTNSSIIVDGQTITAGITPDSPFYGLFNFFDDVRLFFTFDNTAKANLAINLARQKILAVRQMIEDNNTAAAKIATNDQAKMLQVAETALTNIQNANASDQLMNVIQIQKQIELYQNEVDDISNEIEFKAGVLNLTSTQQATIGSFASSLRNETDDTKLKVEQKLNETENEIQTQTGENETEIENEVNVLQDHFNVTIILQEKAQERISDAKDEIANVVNLLSTTNTSQFNVTAVNVLLSQAQAHLTSAETAYNQTNYGEAYGQATAAEHLAENAANIIEQEVPEIEHEGLSIEAEVQGNETKVDAEVNGMSFEFTVNSTDPSVIANLISERTGLNIAQVSSALQIKSETEAQQEQSQVEQRISSILNQTAGRD